MFVPCLVAAPTNVHRFFDQEAFSDVTVRFGARERKCHKMTICSKSEYFMDLCGPGKRFPESQQPLVELKDDDEDAVEAVLRWLYTFDYEECIDTDKPDNRLDFQLNVCVVADKHLLMAFKEEAVVRVTALLESSLEDEFVTFYKKVRGLEADLPDAVVDVVDCNRDERLDTLLEHSGFRGLMETDTKLCVKIIDKLRINKTTVISAIGLVEIWYVECTCGRRETIDKIDAPMLWVCTRMKCQRILYACSWKQCWMDMSS